VSVVARLVGLRFTNPAGGHGRLPLVSTVLSGRDLGLGLISCPEESSPVCVCVCARVRVCFMSCDQVQQ
jgi:hypothetical protein